MLLWVTRYKQGSMHASRTSIRPLIGADITEMDDMFALQLLEEEGKALCLDLADGDTQRLHPCGGDRQKGVCAHGSESIPPMLLGGLFCVCVCVLCRGEEGRRCVFKQHVVEFEVAWGVRKGPQQGLGFEPSQRKNEDSTWFETCA